MSRTTQIAAVGVCLAAVAPWLATLPGRSPVAAASQGTVLSANPAPTPEQIHALIAHAIENQHADDRALEEFERVERVITRKGQNAEVLSDHTDRILFSGTGPLKVRIAENGVPVTPGEYRRALEFAVMALDTAIHPNDHFRQDLVKFQKRRRERAELVDEAGKALRATWAGRETRGGRTLMKLALGPEPNYRPATRFAVVFQHIHATLWVDESEAQFARLEGDISSDIAFAGGIAGKIYRGGHFVMEQEEAAPGTWLPTLFTYDVDGRKFLFAFGVHQRTEITRYHRVGPPSQAIEILRNELNNLAADAPAPRNN